MLNSFKIKKTLQRSHYHVASPLPSPFSYIFFLCQSFVVIICSVKVHLKLDVTRGRATQSCLKGAHFIASFEQFMMSNLI